MSKASHVWINISVWPLLNRVSQDVDASFSRRIALPDDLQVAYRDADGAARLLYFDRQYNDTLGLLHEDAYDDSERLTLGGIDARILDVRVLSPLDLAVSKIGRYTDQDREDIAALARRGLISAKALRQRADVAMANYVGDTARLRTSIDMAARSSRTSRIGALGASPLLHTNKNTSQGPIPCACKYSS